jgi:signal transduction histidine kinase
MVDASAYRIVQEALTNALRHAGDANVRLSVRRVGERLEIEVLDDGPGSPAAGEGHGIAGMRERAAALGGTFHAGRMPGGGWCVSSVLPVGGRAT